eukprot:7047254-Pyramimonas_sp.AAC.1
MEYLGVNAVELCARYRAAYGMEIKPGAITTVTNAAAMVTTRGPSRVSLRALEIFAILPDKVHCRAAFWPRSDFLVVSGALFSFTSQNHVGSGCN